jgi:hypothetical protein
LDFLDQQRTGQTRSLRFGLVALDSLNFRTNRQNRAAESPREAPDLEVYDQRFKYGSDDSELDIYIPVK